MMAMAVEQRGGVWIQGDLFWDVASLPWYGVTPRDLTRARQSLFSKRERQKTTDFADPEQLEFAFVSTVLPWKYTGAPLLQEVD